MTLEHACERRLHPRASPCTPPTRCQDAPRGAGDLDLHGHRRDGALVNTSDLGTHAFSVTAVERGRPADAARSCSTTVTNTFARAILATHHGIVSLEVTGPAAGSINVLETAGYAELARLARRLVPGPAGFAYARRTSRPRRPRTVIIAGEADAARTATPRPSPWLDRAERRGDLETPSHGRSQTEGVPRWRRCGFFRRP